MQDLYVTTAIPYVNGAPHLGHALEVVRADWHARHRRLRGGAARLQSGTDDHALKNVAAASAVGADVASFVREHGDRFVDLAAALGVRPDAFVRTSDHPGHRDAVTALWRACAASGDLYRREYVGRYCAGCEQFVTDDDLVDRDPAGVCPEHLVPPVEVRETNWFFRLSRYADRVAALVADGTVDVVPAPRRREVLGFLAGEVHDLSVSRPAARAGGWGVPVPDDPDQVVYVWFDALVNYLTGLGWTGGPDGTAPAYARWWAGDAERVHVVGKGIVRFHAVHWVAFLLSAGLPLPTRVLVHDYVTVDGAKVAKSGRQAADPEALVEQYGADALRWWLLREPAPVGGTDFTVHRLVDAHDRDLANGVGNLVQRTVVLARRLPGAGTPSSYDAESLHHNAFQPSASAPAGVRRLHDRTAALPGLVDEHVRRDDPRAAAVAVTEVVAEAGRLLGAEEPWKLVPPAGAGHPVAAQRFCDVLGALLQAADVVTAELGPFVPDGATRLRDALDLACAPAAAAGPRPAFPRLAVRP